MNSSSRHQANMISSLGHQVRQVGNRLAYQDESAGETALHTDPDHSTLPLYEFPIGRIPSAKAAAVSTQTFRFARTRWWTGIRKLIAALLLIVIGAFLLASLIMDKASSTLILDTAILSFGGIVGGIGLLISAIRDMRGYVSMSREGIQICTGLPS
jgi:hypothetical protein